MQRIASVLLVVALSSASSAQSASGTFMFGTQQLPVYDQGDEQRITLVAPNGVRSRLVAGDFTGDARVDAVLLDASGLLLLRGVAVWRDTYPLNLAANDLALAPPLSVPGPSTLVAATDTGLERLHGWNGADFARTSLGDAAWNGALRVLVDDAAPRIVGIASDQQTVLVLHDPFGSSATTSIALTSTLLDLALLDWDGDGDRDIAAIATGGLFVFEADGTSLFTVPGGVGTAVMVAFEQAGFAAGRLAAVVTWPGGDEQYLHVLDQDTVDAVVAFGPAQVHGLDARDVNDDGADDLFIVHRASHDAALFFNQSNGAPPITGEKTFSFTSGQLVPLGPTGAPGLGQAINPSLEDLDLDGDVDLILFVDQDEELLLQMNNSEEFSKSLFSVGSQSTFTLDVSAMQGELQLDAIEPEIKYPADATHLEVSLYELPSATGKATESGVIGHYPLAGDWGLDVLATLFEQDMTFDGFYVLELRPLVWSALFSTPLDSGPSTLIAFTTPIELLLELQALWGGTEEIIPVAPWILEPGSSAPVPYVDSEQRDLAPAVIKIPVIEL